MELALYCPNCGYYEREEDIIGRRGDYYTSVSVGSLFGELLAFQFAEWLQPHEKLDAEGLAGGPSAAMRIVEAGAHGGDLATDILRWMREQCPGLFRSLEYWIVEPSTVRQQWQFQKLSEYASKVRWVKHLAGLTANSARDPQGSSAAGFRGILFSNELLDAMPVHRLGWDAKARVWFEWGVTLHAGRFVWSRMPTEGSGFGGQGSGVTVPFSHYQISMAEGLSEKLPGGFTIEYCPAAEQWWREAAMALRCGKLLAIDYGLTAQELFAPGRKEVRYEVITDTT